MAITVEIILADVSQALLWESLTITETIGQPDTLSLDLYQDDEVTGVTGVATLFDNHDNYYYIAVYLDDYPAHEVLFSGLVQTIERSNDASFTGYKLTAVGWEFLLPKRLVGVPDGNTLIIQEAESSADELPTPVVVDPNATVQPSNSGIQAMFAAYWGFPAIDTTTYVFDLIGYNPVADDIVFSGTELGDATRTVCDMCSTDAMFWFANDAPAIGNTAAPYLALHVGIVTLPADGEDGSDIAAGYPSDAYPIPLAPYMIDDEPDWTTSIMPTRTPKLRLEHGQRVGGVYVRGATGYVPVVVPDAFGYTVSGVDEGGTGWVGSPGGPWGEAYVDAPAAITSAQRDAFGNAWLAAYNRPSVSGTIPVEGGWHGWHKAQALRVTDAGLGLDGRWVLIRGVTLRAKVSDGSSIAYDLQVGDVLTPQLAWQLRQQRLREQRQEIRPATRFIPYISDLLLEAGDTEPLVFQLANDAGKAVAVAGVGAEFHLVVDGTDVADVEDAGGLFYLTDIVDVTDQLGQVTATLNAGAGVTAANACKPWAAVVL